MHKNCSKLCTSILTFGSHYPVLQNVFFFFCFCFVLFCFFFAGRPFSLEKWKSKWPTVRNMCFQKLWKNIIFHNKTLLVMFYRHNKTFWYQFCNFKHFLKAENSEDSLASSCVGFSIGLSCNPVWDWVTIGTSLSCNPVWDVSDWN